MPQRSCTQASDHRRRRLTSAVIAIAVGLVTGLPDSGSADEVSATTVRGGRLYDNWIKETRSPSPARHHPAYPEAARAATSTAKSWRCVACHGWDYRGRAPVRARDGNLIGIDRLAGAEPAAVREILVDAVHGYQGVLGERELRDLAAFVSAGQIDMDLAISAETGRARVDGGPFVDLYQTVCANCHGPDGMRISSMAPLGGLARSDPWETLHKILNGHPRERMPALRALGLETAGVLLAVAQSLPEANRAASIARGGRLYDNWMKETGRQEPTWSQPAYPRDARFAARPQANWRCKECHGWDYKGKHGQYGEGRHRTGITGVRGSAGVAVEDVLAVLGDDQHPYGDKLDYRDRRDLAHFVTAGQMDMDRYIDAASGRSRGDAKAQVGLYETLCARCHGIDGIGIPTSLALGPFSRRNPWATLHLLANGHPDESMPALREIGTPTLADILAHLQNLPDFD